MSRQCELTGVKPLTGNNVSHSHRKTKRRFLPNLIRATLRSDTLERDFRFRIAAKALRHIDKQGGLDAYLLKAKDSQLSPAALRLKKTVQKAG